MVRLARKLFLKGLKVVRINLRGAGSGKGLSKIPYCGGSSEDIFKVLQALKKTFPQSEIQLIGFSLGGNIVLKWAGELGQEAKNFVKTLMAICAPLDLRDTVRLLEQVSNRFYHYAYLKDIVKKTGSVVKSEVRTMYEYDDKVTPPLWGFANADAYYHSSSSIYYIPKIECPTKLLYAADDPFVSLSLIKRVTLPDCVQLFATKYGGHMGYLGHTKLKQDLFWLDQLLMNWVQGDYTSDLVSENEISQYTFSI
jgi:predicted alpha/beta-fold hydrolase